MAKITKRAGILTVGAAAAAAVAAAAVIWNRAAPGPEHPGLLPYLDAAAVAEGRQIYGEFCASCHGTGLEGQPGWQERDAEGYLPAPPHDAGGHTWHHPDAQLIAITAYGSERMIGNGYKSRMQGYGEILSTEEILQVLAYIKSTWPREVIERHNEINRMAGS